MISLKAVRIDIESHKRSQKQLHEKKSCSLVQKSKSKKKSSSMRREKAQCASPKIKPKEDVDNEESVRKEYKLFRKLMKNKKNSIGKKISKDTKEMDQDLLKKATNFFNKNLQFCNDYMLKPAELTKKEKKKRKQPKKIRENPQKRKSVEQLSKKSSLKNFSPLLHSPRLSSNPSNKERESMSFNLLPFV